MRRRTVTLTNAYFRELSYIVKRPSIALVAVIIIVLILTAVYPYFPHYNEDAHPLIHPTGFYADNGTFHIVVYYARNSLPVSGVNSTVTLSLNVHGNLTVPNSIEQTAISNKEGFANTTIHVANYSLALYYKVNFTYSEGDGRFLNGSFWGSNGGIAPYNLGYSPYEQSGYSVVKYPSSTDAGMYDLEVMYVGQNSTQSPNLSIYYAEGQVPAVLSNLTFYSNTGTFHVTSLKIRIPGSLYLQAFSIYLMSNSSIPVAQYYGYLSVNAAVYGSVDNILYASNGYSTWELFLPLASIYVGMVVYGFDRVTGMLESIESKPTTKPRLLLNRYLSGVTVLVIANLSVSLLELTFLISSYGPSYPSQMTPIAVTKFMTESLAFDVVAASFLGIVILISRCAKSLPSLIAYTFAVYAVTTLFWGTITSPIFNALSLIPGKEGYASAWVYSTIANPDSLFNSLIAYWTGYLLSSQQTIPQKLLQQMPTMIIFSSLFWIVVPMGLALYHSTKKD